MSELVGQETGRRWVEALYRENYEVVRRLARSLLTGNLKSMAEDVAQEVFVDAQEQQEALKRHPNVRGWLMLTTKYKCFNLLRTRKKVQVIYIDDEEMERIEDEHCAWQLQAALETPRSREDVDRALQENLSPREQTLFHQHYEEHIDCEQLAALRRGQGSHAASHLPRRAARPKRDSFRIPVGYGICLLPHGTFLKNDAPNKWAFPKTIPAEVKRK